MKIVSHRKLKEFYETKGNKDLRVALERWYSISEKAEWKNLSDIKVDFPTTDYVGNQHYVFNIKQYEFALEKVEQLLPTIDDSTPINDRRSIELSMMSDIIIEYEKEHYPIGQPAVSELIELSLETKRMTQKELAGKIGISPSRINDYVSGRSEPTLKIARLLCRTLDIPPAVMLGF